MFCILCSLWEHTGPANDILRRGCTDVTNAAMSFRCLISRSRKQQAPSLILPLTTRIGLQSQGQAPSPLLWRLASPLLTLSACLYLALLVLDLKNF